MLNLYPLPVNWQWTYIAYAGDVITGSTPSTSNRKFYGGSIPFVKPPDLLDESIWETNETLSDLGLMQSRELPAGAVLVSCIGILGKTAIAQVRCASNQQINAIVFHPEVLPEFGFYYAQTLKGWLSSAASATTIPIVNKGKFEQAPFPLAPKAEQTRIVAKLEELLSDLDAAVAELKAAQKKLAQYRQALLKAAVEGTLTAAWRAAHAAPFETGAQLLTRILAERRHRWQQKQLAKFKAQGKTPPPDWQDKYPEPLPPDTTGLPELPEGWTWATIDQCAADDESITDGPFGSNLKSSHYTDAGPRVIRLKNIGDGVFVDARAFISPEHYAFLAKHSVNEGDLVVAMLGETLPRACVIPNGIMPAIVKADCARVRVNQSLLLPEILNAYLNSPPIRKRVGRLVKGIGRPRINLSNLRAICIPIPPMDEQQEMMTSITAGLASIAEQARAIDLALKQADAQRKNILKSAFSGQLVPQDATDEPASVLLERIRTARANRTKVRKRGGNEKAVVT